MEEKKGGYWVCLGKQEGKKLFGEPNRELKRISKK
jgi:hypothetical protein